MYDADAYQSMRAFRKPFITIHEYNFFVLSFFVVFHIAAVIVTEVREGGGLISAMFSGRKIFNKEPIDAAKSDYD
jgi:Ni/Fe-hydrogenase 1 B-type cytochrome subunit